VKTGIVLESLNQNTRVFSSARCALVMNFQSHTQGV
jgi:hypothetical protein